MLFAPIYHFLSFQRSDGKIPRKISLDVNVLKYLTGTIVKRRRPRPTYHGLVKPFYAKDSELLLVKACAEYVQKTHDTDFLVQHYPKIKKAIMWHMCRTKNNLITEYFLGNWMDTIFKFGPVLYTNVLYFHALCKMAELAKLIDEQKDYKKFLNLSKVVKKEICIHFWRETFFADEMYAKNQKTFDVAGNVLAVLFDVADHDRKNMILQHCEAYVSQYGTFIPIVPTKYRWWKVNPIVRLFGIADYHTQASWLWINAFLMLVFAQNKKMHIAQKMAKDLSYVCSRDGEVGETYFIGGTIYKKRFWKSASPFAWSSGVLLAVLEECQFVGKYFCRKT